MTDNRQDPRGTATSQGEIPVTRPESSPSRRSQLFGQATSEYAMLAFFVAIAVVFSVLRPDTFATAANWRTLLGANALIGLTALAVMIVYVVGEFDLSIAAVAGLANVLAAGLTSQQGLPVTLAVLIVLGVSAAIGLLHAALIAWARLDSLIVTLGTSSILAGGILMYTRGRVIAQDIPPELVLLGRTRLAGVQVPFYAFLAATVILWFLLEQRPWGRQLYAVGVNEEAARLAGVDTIRLKATTLVVSALLSGTAGILLAGRSAVGHPTITTDFLLPAFAAAFLGTAGFRIGFPNAWGTFVAIYGLAFGVTGLTMIGAPYWVNGVFNGAALILAIGLAQWRLRSGHRARDRATTRNTTNTESRPQRNTQEPAAAGTPPEL